MEAPIKPIGNNKVEEGLMGVALKIAQSQIGQSEDPIGSNSGKMVNEYLHAVGLGPGYAWCQAFVYWCFDCVAKTMGKGAQNPVAKTAGVHDCWNKTPLGKRLSADNVLADKSSLKPGMQFVLLFGGTTGHTGIVESIAGDWFYTIEGNSNNTGSREGYEVVRHKRSFTDKHLVGFIDYEG